jgi:hypothetical protein
VPVPRISKEDLKARIDAGQTPVLIDARLKYPYEHSTMKLPGAIRFLGDGPLPPLSREEEIVVYDSDPNELASSRVAAELIRQGYRLRVEGRDRHWRRPICRPRRRAPKQRRLNRGVEGWTPIPSAVRWRSRERSPPHGHSRHRRRAGGGRHPARPRSHRSIGLLATADTRPASHDSSALALGAPRRHRSRTASSSMARS